MITSPRIIYALFFVGLSIVSAKGQDKQPFYRHADNVLTTLSYIGAPVSDADEKVIHQLMQDESAPNRIAEILDQYALFNLEINPESRVKVSAGLSKPELFQSGWKTFLIKVENQAGITAKLQVSSEQAKRPYDGGERIYGMAGASKGSKITKQNILDRWLDIGLYTQSPMKASLSGLEVEYFIIQLYSRDAGKRAAKLAFNCGQGTQDLGFRNEADVLFTCLPSKKVRLEIQDESQSSIPMASFIIKDRQGHIYPSQMKRLAPDFFFQPQIYRSHNEKIDLPPGTYTIEYGRGPEYFTKTKTLTVTEADDQKFSIRLERWINLQKLGWYSGDHHIHAAGCSHYTSPTEGVNPEDMMRHVLGEDVNVGSVLTWGPGYYHQKQFFEGKDNKLSTKDNLLRYDLEISGFPSSHAGHLVLLRLKEQDYPNATTIEAWPSYTIPVLRWAKAQNAITGYAHSGLGLEVRNDALPNYEMPRFDGIGANEYIVAVTQNLVDFISTMDTPPTWELNIWYHTLNCGFRTRISGETDFPCMSDDKVAYGRSYVELEKGLSYDAWAEGLRSGRNYVSEGKSHIVGFKVNNVAMGTGNSQVDLNAPSTVRVSAAVAAYLKTLRDTTIKAFDVNTNVWEQKPFWNLERGRIGNTRNVTVELVVNGKVVDQAEILADGKLTDINFNTSIEESSWVALRILPSSHTNPVFVLVDNKPIRADWKSADWCVKAVDVCWQQKQGLIAAAEKEAAKKDYDNAKAVYQQIMNECRNP